MNYILISWTIASLPQISVGQMWVAVNVAIWSGAKTAYVLTSTMGTGAERNELSINIFSVVERKTFFMCWTQQVADDVRIVGLSCCFLSRRELR